MGKRFTLGLVFAIALWGTNVFAQGHGHGKLETTGLEHAEDRANVHGQKGIENAEEKQAQHKKHKSKRHHHHHATKKDKDKQKGHNKQ